MVDELNMEDKKRHSSFHHNDSLISVEDLWHTWKGSEGSQLLYNDLHPAMKISRMRIEMKTQILAIPSLPSDMIRTCIIPVWIASDLFHDTYYQFCVKYLVMWDYMWFL